MNGRRFRIEYGETALTDLEKLPSNHREQVIRKIGRLERGLHGDIKRLRDADFAYRLCMGVYRILFDVERDVIIVRRIGHRKDVYD